MLGLRLELRRPPLCPELELWLLADGLDLEQACPELMELSAPPFWAFAWGSGQALARFALDRPRVVRGRRVADFGSGCGIVAIAAAAAGARSVCAVDIDLDALDAARRNARHNGFEISTSTGIPTDADLIFAGDVAYETGNFDRLRACAREGREVWLADPARQGTPPVELRARHHYEVCTFPDVDAPQSGATLYRL